MVGCGNLLSYERALLIAYLNMTRVERDKILDLAYRDPKTSGPLIHAYRFLRFA